MKDEWVTAALFDDTVVADLLFRLKQSSSQLHANPPSLSLPLGWGHRQPRSKPTTKKDSTTRCSPTTPLSWSDGAYDDSSNSSRPSSDPSRSKDAFGNDTTIIISSNNKRLTKKKTFVELKEVESLLLKERVTLKRELASLHVTFKEQKARSENLKRIKIDLNLQTSGEGEECGTSGDIEVALSNQCNQMEASTSDQARPALPKHGVQDGFGSSGSCRVEKEVDMEKSCFVLPDLNMMPSEEEIGPEILHGISSK